MAHHPPKSLSEDLLSASRRYSRAHFARGHSLTGDELSHTDWHFLVRLQHWPDPEGAMPSELARCQKVTAGNVAQQLRSLEKQDLVVRRHDEQDRRVVRVKLTSKGQEKLEQVRTAFIRQYVQLIEHLGSEDADKFIQLLISAAEFLEVSEGSSC